MPVRFVLFDMGNVLIRYDHRRMTENLARLFDSTPEKLADILFSPEFEPVYEAGKMSGAEYYNYVCRNFEKESVEKDFVAKETEREKLIFNANNIFLLNVSLFPVLQKLEDNQIARGVLSNVGENHWRFCRKRFPVLWHFFPECCFASYQEGFVKPNREIYESAFRKISQKMSDLIPKEILFVDDNEKNLQGAQEFGFKGHLFALNDPDALLRRLYQENVF